MKLRNIFTFALACMMAFNTIQAQNKLGVKVEYGLNAVPTQSTFLVNEFNQVEHELSIVSATPAQSIGLYSAFDFGYIFLQPEALYTSYSMNFEIENFNSQVDAPSTLTVTEKIQQFDIPVYAGVRYKFLKFGAGPVFHIGQHIESSFSDLGKLSVKPAQISAGFQAGIGLDLKYVNVDVKYQREFNSVTDHIEYNSQPVGIKSSLSGIRIGIAFNIAK